MEVPVCNQKKTALRAAMLIHEHMTGHGFQADLPYLPEYSWNNIQRLQRQVQRAQDRG